MASKSAGVTPVRVTELFMAWMASLWSCFDAAFLFQGDSLT